MSELIGELDGVEVWRIIYTSGRWYALKVDFEEDLQNIEVFVAGSTTTVLTTDLETAISDLQITIGEVTIIDSD